MTFWRFLSVHGALRQRGLLSSPLKRTFLGERVSDTILTVAMRVDITILTPDGAIHDHLARGRPL